MIALGAGVGGLIKAIGAEKAFIIMLSGAIVVPETIRHFQAVKDFLITYPNSYIIYETVGRLLAGQ